MKTISSLVLLALALGGCSRSPAPQVPPPASTKQSTPPDVKGALHFFATNHPPFRAERIDKRTIGVIWESGAKKEFEAFRAKVKKDFGVDSIITATE